MSCLRTAAAIALLVATSACGGSSTNLPLQSLTPTAPSAPVQTDWSVSGRITSLTGAPVGRAGVTPSDSASVLSDAAGNYTIAANGQPSQNPYPLQVTANGYLRRRVWVEWQHGARTGVDINLISVAAPFSLTFYQQLARDSSEGAPQPLALWPGGNPRIYVRTVDQNGNAISPAVLSSVYSVIPEAVSDWTSGKLTVASMDQGTATRPRQDGWIIVNFITNPSGGDICGQSYVGALNGLIELVNGACTCGGSAVPNQVVAHEVGHAMGFFHVSDPGSLMYPQASPNCTNTSLSAAERFHSGIAWTREPGNLDPDLDPSGLTPLSRRDILVVN
jgi:Carboxypeptidase regulatory-like domain/Matrixin